MRFTSLAVALLACAAFLTAAESAVGTWKLNLAKSKYTKGTPPKEQTLTIMEHGPDMHVVVKGVAADGKAISSSFTVPKSGGPGKIIESPYDAVSSKRISDTERENTYSKAGKAVYTSASKINHGGKTMTITAKGIGLSGKEVEVVGLYDKQ